MKIDVVAKGNLVTVNLTNESTGKTLDVGLTVEDARALVGKIVAALMVQ
jgi:hypothetical protein